MYMCRKYISVVLLKLVIDNYPFIFVLHLVACFYFLI